MQKRDLLSCFRPRQAVIAAVVFWCGLIIFVDVNAQDRPPDVEGVVTVSDWPEHRRADAAPLDYGKFRLLPFIDTLIVGYRFTEVADKATMELALEWQIGERGVLNGRQVKRAQLPDRVIVESIDLLAKVVVDEQVVGEFFLPLDTLRLGPSPSVARVEIRDVDWASVFSDVSEEKARELFRTGFQLEDLRILRVVFDTEAPSRVERQSRRRGEDWTTVCVPDVDIWVSWGTRRRWRPPITHITRSTRDRRDEIGRSDLVERERPERGYDRPSDTDVRPGETTTDEPATDEADDSSEDRRAARRKGDSNGRGGIPIPRSGKDDDDDDDDDRLLPAALAGAAIVGGLAVLGGTFGYFGSYGKAPLGLFAGRVRPNGGVLLHVAVNRQVFGKTSGPENLVAGVTGFMDVFHAPVQPSVGLGLRITEEGTETTRTLPSLAVGLVGNLDQLILHLAYDVESHDVRFGIGVNLKAGDRY